MKQSGMFGGPEIRRLVTIALQDAKNSASVALVMITFQSTFIKRSS